MNIKGTVFCCSFQTRVVLNYIKIRKVTFIFLLLLCFPRILENIKIIFHFVIHRICSINFRKYLGTNLHVKLWILMVTDKINLYKFIFKSQILFTKHGEITMCARKSPQ